MDIIREITKSFSIPMAADLYTRRVYSKDLWPRNLVLAREETATLGEPPIAAVVWPESLEQLSQLVRVANEREWELMPYGAGSGVCGGATSEKGARPRIVVDLKRMDKIEEIDEVSQVAKVQAGIMGQVLEEDLNQRGYTLGHFPSSIYCSSFGGYLATRAAGQLSTYYGKIEDMVLALEGVLPTGDVFHTTLAPRMATGPDWNAFLVGSEGTLAFLTSAWVKVHRLPQARHFLGFQAGSTAQALDGVRKWLQAGLRPAVLRIYDEDESRMLHSLKSGVKLVAVVEGDTPLTEFTAGEMSKMAESFEGFVETGPESAEDWWSHRYDVSYRQQQVLSHRRMVLDTFEVSTTWANLPGLHRAVKSVVSEMKADGMLVLLAHFSHFYHNGGNIYFTLCGAAGEEKNTAEFYDKIWERLLNACMREGAAVSHHHGIGRLKAKAFQRQKGPLFDALKKLKNELDPKHLLNPQNLGL